MVPGTVYELSISLSSTAYVFNVKHRIRLAISSSNFPRFDANPNSGLPLTESGTGPRFIALNAVHLGDDQQPGLASRLVLPIVQPSQLPKVDIT